ncbi:MAG: hypothetical protein JWP01_142 [Myxococcales bacterium]|nr:hypothetical protein [Myxococcales bacterium]
MLFRITIGVVLLISAACGKRTTAEDDDDPSSYDSIEIEPAQATLTVPLGGTATQDYAVVGIRGTRRTDITGLCGFTIDSAFGTFTDATVTVGPRGGKTGVTAGCGTVTATAQLAVNLTGTVIMPGTPANAADLFNGATTATDPARTPKIEYPLDKAVSPRNIPPVEVQYVASGNDLFHVTMTSTFLSVDLYTTSVEAMMSVADWDAITWSAAGAELAITVEGLAQAAPTSKYASPATTLTMSNDNIDKTAIYYWASSQGNVMSQTFGSLTPPSVVKGDCTSCHSVSRSGTRIGYSRCVNNNCSGETMGVGFMRYDAVTKTWNEIVNANALAIKGSYTTFAPVGNPFPSDDQAVAMVTLNNATFALYDPDTGTQIPSNLSVANATPNGAPSTRAALMPDWAPDGTKVVYVSGTNPGQWIDLSGGAIATMSYNYTAGTHTFGDPQYLVNTPVTLPHGTFSNFFFPSFSPDGELVVFNAARTGWRANPAHTAGQRLMLAKSDGTWVQDLNALNGGYVDSDITWPHWAPAASNEYYWVVFSSQRDYGHRVTRANSHPSCVANGVLQCKQLWLGAIAKNKLTGGIDPSAPPMWLPGQDMQADNISPFWSVPAGIQ